MSKAPNRIPVGGLAAKLARSFTAAPETGNPGFGEKVEPANPEPRNTVSGETVRYPVLKQAIQELHPDAASSITQALPQTVSTVPPTSGLTVQPLTASTVLPQTAEPPSPHTVSPVSPFQVNPVTPQTGMTIPPEPRLTAPPETVVTDSPQMERKKKTSLELPWDVKTRLALWRARLRAEGLPATESGIIVALARAATIESVRQLLLSPQAGEDELPETGER
jgi:hypothetical protein